jgi:hypothetical protein
MNSRYGKFGTYSARATAASRYQPERTGEMSIGHQSPYAQVRGGIAACDQACDDGGGQRMAKPGGYGGNPPGFASSVFRRGPGTPARALRRGTRAPV